MFRGTQGHPRVVQNFTYGAITHYGGTFQSLPLFFTNPMLGPYNPGVTLVTPVWADPRSLAATYGIVITFFSSGYLDVSVHQLPTIRLCIHLNATSLFMTPGYPIRKPPDQSSIAAPRGISSLTTSFIGPLPQGIHRAPFIAYTKQITLN